jgi:hypothetical protein
MVMNNDIWKPIYINGEKTKYEISDNNGFRSTWGRREGNLGIHLDKQGYRHVFIYHNGGRVVKKYHRLIGECFLSNPNNYRCINHKDCNKLNNIPSNLEYCTHSHNNQHAHDNGLKKMRKGKDHYLARPVGQYFCGSLVKRYDSMSDANKEGFDKRNIFSAIKLNGRHKGYHWKYLD